MRWERVVREMDVGESNLGEKDEMGWELGRRGYGDREY